MLLVTLAVELGIGYLIIKTLIVQHVWSSFLTLLVLANLAYLIFFLRKILGDWSFFRRQPKDWLYVQWKEWGEPFLIALILATIIRTFILGPYKIPTGSMIPTFLVGDRIFVDKISYRFHPPNPGDIVVFKYPLDRKKDFVKRLAGLPGDEIEIRGGRLILNGRVMEDPPFSDHYYYNREDWDYAKKGQRIKVPADSYFVLGDNSDQSSDSRHWGFVPKKDLIGKAVFIWWPPNRIKLVK
ncbi:MAG: signal peptidase I [Candidatus Omnitrophica bacterium]|nr:signal peptidase I [Candidatus Omnitrophota bacterium]